LDKLKTTNVRHQTHTRFVIFLLLHFSLCLWGRGLWLPVGKVNFACLWSSLKSSLNGLAWEQYKLAQVLNSNVVSEWLC